jgi:hypothetical protein
MAVNNEQMKNILLVMLLVWGLGVTTYLLVKKDSTPTTNADSSGDYRQAHRQQAINKKEHRGDDIDPYEKKQVKNTLIKNGANEIQDCFNKYLEAAPAKEKVEAGRINVDWQILPDGKVEKPEVVSSEFNNISFHACIVGVIGGLEFPPPPQSSPYYVFHKFFFKKAEEEEKSASQ